MRQLHLIRVLCAVICKSVAVCRFERRFVGSCLPIYLHYTVKWSFVCKNFNVNCRYWSISIAVKMLWTCRSISNMNLLVWAHTHKHTHHTLFQFVVYVSTSLQLYFQSVIQFRWIFNGELLNHAHACEVFAIDWKKMPSFSQWYVLSYFVISIDKSICKLPVLEIQNNVTTINRL